MSRATNEPGGVSRKQFLRMAALSAGAVGAVPLLSACGGSGEKGGGKNELTYMNHSRGQAAVLDKLVAVYKKKTGITIRMNHTGPVDFIAKLQSKSQSGDMPDIYSAVGYPDMVPYYKAGWAMNLQEHLSGAWGDSMTPATKKLSTVPGGNSDGLKPGIYAVYWELSLYGLLANTKSFASAGSDLATPPATTDRLITQLSKMGGKGQGAFSVAASLVPFLVQSHASNWLTDEEIDATFAGKSGWNSEGWRNAFQLLVDMRDAGVLSGDALPGGSDDNTQVEKSFFNVQDVAAVFDGSFGIGVARTTAPDFTAYQSLGLPKAPDARLDPRPAGVLGKGACVNPKGKNPDEALKFVKWLTEPAQAKDFMDQVPLVPTNPQVLSSKVSPELAGFASIAKQVQVVPTPMNDKVFTAMQSLSQSLVLKERSVSDVLKELEKAQAKA